MKEILKKTFYIFLPIVLGSLVGLFIASYIDYSELLKPPLAPPKIVFPIAWSIIYLLMGISWYILKKNDLADADDSLFYYGQLIVNLLWSIIFFVLKWRLVAVIWIIILTFMVYRMIVLFKRKSETSAWLNVFYLLWIIFATYLSIGIYMLN